MAERRLSPFGASMTGLVERWKAVLVEVGCARLDARSGFRKRLAMDVLPLSITAPVISHDASLWFSAYGFGWGYCAVSLPIQSVCKHLGAADASAGQLMLAFELGRKRILRAVEQIEIPETGDRVVLIRLDT
jgi:hypothetical protein